ncbi:RNA polymerase sigma factor [Arthrobacter ulcerisalmonis]|uniref:RNA polymerase sigma factor n=1 Tax=Arthrobacter ulcerisalmonis TaxID=2483813 RepID=UPI00362AD2A1
MGTEIRTARVENATREHAPALLAYFARRVDQPHDAADLLAETLLVLWRRASALPVEDTEVRPWMFGIGRNVLMHYRRRALRQRAISDKLRSILSATPAPASLTLPNTTRSTEPLRHWTQSTKTSSDSFTGTDFL